MSFLGVIIRNEGHGHTHDVRVQLELVGQDVVDAVRIVQMLVNLVHVVHRRGLHQVEHTFQLLVRDAQDVLVVILDHSQGTARGEQEDQQGDDGHRDQHHQQDAAGQSA